jgi:autotransporter-associated beta strand protein
MAEWAKRIGMVLLCLAASVPRTAEAVTPLPHNKPNIVFILADDLGYGDVSCQNPASKIRTPRLDTLASQGMSFKNAHAPSALCTPSRYGFLTGQYCWRTRLESGVLNMWDEPLVAPERLTVAGLLRDQGYTNGCFGKWHLGMSWPFIGKVPPGFDTNVTPSAIDWSRRISGGPVDHGFDYYFGINIPNQPPYAFIQNDHVVGVPTVRYDTVTGQQSHWAGPGVPGWDWSQVLPCVVSNAAAWVQQCAASSPAQPFFLYLALPGPHQPVVPTAQFRGSSRAGAYGDYVQELDWAVGQVLDQIESSGIATNTLVIFSSDNGPDEFAYPRLQQYGHSSMGVLRGIKSDLWEGGHRVPFIAKWPGQVAAGSTSSQIICLVDFLRTVADLLGVQLPANSAEDSVSFLPAILGTSAGAGRSSLILESGPGQFGFWTNNWMFIDASTGDGHDPELEPLWFKQLRGYPLSNSYPALLYNLSSDLVERTNLYAAQPGLAGLLQEQLRGQRAMLTWCGAQSGAWVNGANWSAKQSPAGCDVHYSNATHATNFDQILGTSFSINSLTVDDIAQKVTISAGGPYGLTLYNGIDMDSATSDMAIETAVGLAQSQMWSVGSNRTLRVDGPVSLNGFDLMTCGQGNVILTNTLSGAGRLTIRSSGFVLLGGNNSFSGGVELSGGGFLVAQHSHALGVGSLDIPNNSTLQADPGVILTNPVTLAGFGDVFANAQCGAVTMYHPGQAELDGPVTLSGDTGFFARHAGAVLTIGGPISGEANVTIMPGAGTVVFAANNSYDGATLIGGTLKLANGTGRLPPTTRLFLANSNTASLDLDGHGQTVSLLCGGGTNGGNVALESGTLVVDQIAPSIYAGSLRGLGGLTKANSGTLTLAGTNDYVGTTRVSGGTLLVNGRLGNSSVFVSGGTLGGNGVITGPVTVETAGVLSPGPGLGALTISNGLTLADGSATTIQIDAVRHLSTCLRGLSHVTYGGTLLVNNISGAGTLAAGQSFRVFGAGASSGNFAAIGPAPGAGLAWRFIPETGMLVVVAQPIIHITRADSGHMLVSWTDSSFHLQIQTNSLASGLTTNWFDYPGGAASPILLPLIQGNEMLMLRLVGP